MKKTALNLLLILLFIAGGSNAQTRPGSLKGKVTDKTNGEILPFAIVLVKQGEDVIATTQTDFDGAYNINPLRPGKYDVIVKFAGFSDSKITDVIIEPDRPRILNIKMEAATEMLQEVVINYEAPLIDGTKTAVTVSGEDMVNMATRSISGVATQTSGVFRSDDGQSSFIRGAMSNTTVYFIDGVKVRGSIDLPQAASVYGYDPYRKEEAKVIDKRADAGNEQYGQYVENTFQEAIGNPFSTFAIDVDGASYSNTRRFLSNGNLPPKDAVRIEEMINYFNYDYPDPEDKHPFAIHTEVSECPWNKENRLLHVGIQGKRLDRSEFPSSNLVFLIDVSGSMHSHDKLPLLQSAFSMLVENLKEEDRIAIVVYAGAAGLVLPSTDVSDKVEILNAINSLRAGGSTAGGAGIQLAYKVAEENFIKGGNNRVILATDGDFNVGVSSNDGLVKMIEEKRESGVFLSVLGFGTGNYKDEKMEQLANKGNGNFNYIDGMLEAEKVLVNEMGGTLVTIAKDVKIQMEFNPAAVHEYRLIGFENRLLNKEDFDDDTKDAGELGAGHSVTAIYEIVPAFKGFKKENADSRYQSTVMNTTALQSGEIGMVHFRYKKPDGLKSKLIEEPIMDHSIPFEEASETFRFSAAVAEFGLLIRESEYSGRANFQRVKEIAKEARGDDPNGYRAEFIRMATIAEGLKTIAYED